MWTKEQIDYLTGKADEMSAYLSLPVDEVARKLAEITLPAIVSHGTWDDLLQQYKGMCIQVFPQLQNPKWNANVRWTSNGVVTIVWFDQNGYTNKIELEGNIHLKVTWGLQYVTLLPVKAQEYIDVNDIEVISAVKTLENVSKKIFTEWWPTQDLMLYTVNGSLVFDKSGDKL